MQAMQFGRAVVAEPASEIESEETARWMRSTALRLTIGSAGDVVLARKLAREFSDRLGFGCVERAAIAAVVSELARTCVDDGGRAELMVRPVAMKEKRGIQVEAGAAQLTALQAAPGGTGVLQLSSSLMLVRRLSDEFEMTARPGGGSVVKAKKWLR